MFKKQNAKRESILAYRTLMREEVIYALGRGWDKHASSAAQSWIEYAREARLA